MSILKLSGLTVYFVFRRRHCGRIAVDSFRITVTDMKL